MNIGFRGRIGLLESLKKFCEEKTASICLPMSLQKGDQETAERAPEVYKMRLPSSSSAKKYAPYILIQFVNGMDKQPHGMNSGSTWTSGTCTDIGCGERVIAEYLRIGPPLAHAVSTAPNKTQQHKK